MVKFLMCVITVLSLGAFVGTAQAGHTILEPKTTQLAHWRHHHHHRYHRIHYRGEYYYYHHRHYHKNGYYKYFYYTKNGKVYVIRRHW